MADEVDKFNVNITLLSDNTFSVKKEECQEDDFVDDKVHISETAIAIDNAELQDCTKHNKIEHEISTTLDNIKTELISSEIQRPTLSDHVKIEKGISADDIKIEFDNGPLYCEDCRAYYEVYCVNCRMLVHILNGNAVRSTDNGSRKELPNGILEIRVLLGEFGIFALKVIPEGVKFGPFTGLGRTKYPWKIKAGKFVVNINKSKRLNWLQYINPARNTSEQNLLIIQYEDNLYYESTRQIQGGDELLVYFGEEYEDRLNTNVGVDFTPTTENIKDVFACTLCSLGFSSVLYLAKHKTICPKDAAKGFSIEEVMQCPFCKFHLSRREYLEHHVASCCERNVRKCMPRTPADNRTVEVNGRKERRRRMLKCKECRYRTHYKADLKNHVNRHNAVKTYKCGICNRRFKTKKSLDAHIFVDVKEETDHSAHNYTNAHKKAEHSRSRDEDTKEFKCLRSEFRTKYKLSLNEHTKKAHLKEFSHKCASCQYRTNTKGRLKIHVKTAHLKELNRKCESCDYITSRNSDLERHTKTRHLKELKYNCDMCDYKTNYRTNLQVHIKTKHKKEFNYKCHACEFKTNRNSDLQNHVKTKHLKEFSYKCEQCDYKTNHKHPLEYHTKAKHSKEFDYKCDACEFKTNSKSNLQSHTNTKHLKEFNYKCEQCDYRTNEKSNLKRHVTTKHTQEFNYRCDVCDYQTSRKDNLEKHVKSKHLQEFNCKCNLCDYKTNHKANLKVHTNTKHLKQFNFTCVECDYMTNQKSNLLIHLEKKHGGLINL